MSIVDGSYRHGLRRMLGRRTDEHGRAATPLELLFDLTFVASFGVAGSELAHGIAEGHWLPALGAFAFSMFALVWAWINVSWFASAFDNDDWLFRVLTMVQMAGVIVVAIGLPPLFASIAEGVAVDNRVMVAGYVVMRVALLVQWLRVAASDPAYRTVALSYAAFVGTAQIGWIVLAVLPLGFVGTLLMAAVLYVIELMGPIVSEAKGAKLQGGMTPWHSHHIAERYALLAIIALGETVFGTLAAAQTISAEQGWSWDAVVVISAGIAMSFALWWAYFLVPHADMLHARRDKAFPWGYGHIILFGAIAAVGAGLHVVGYAYDPHYHVDTLTVVASVAVPVLMFMVTIYLMHGWLLSALPRNTVFQTLVMAFPVLGMVLAAAHTPLWICLLVVLASPVTVIVAFELGSWRALDAQLARSLARAHERSAVHTKAH